MRAADARIVSFFFFQAEDGIRDLTVTGVQTCALPIFVAKRHAKGEFAGNLPIVLSIEVPVGIANADKPWESNFRQDKRVVVFKVRKTAEIVGLLRAQPLIQPVDPDLRPPLYRMLPSRFAHAVKHFEDREWGDLVEGIRSGQRA